MAPVDPDVANSNTIPILRFSAQVSLIAASIAFLAQRFWKTARLLPPSQDVRVLTAQRNTQLVILSALAVLSLAVTSYFNFLQLALSYLEWTHESNEKIPNTLWAGWYAQPSSPNRFSSGLLLGRWLQDTDLVQEAYHIATYKATGAWWASQSYALRVIWSVFVGIEGQKRNLSASTLATYLLVAHFAGISPAINLFSIQLLLTPTQSNSTQKSSLWTVDRRLLSFVVLGSIVSIGYTPFRYPEAYQALVFYYGALIIPTVLAIGVPRLPISFGVYHDSHRDARNYWKPVFFLLSILAASIYWRQTFLSFSQFDSKPSARTRIWNKYLLTQQQQRRSTYNQTKVAAGDIFSSLSDHPVVSGISWDVLLAAASLCTWAVLRGLESTKMLESAVIPGLNLLETTAKSAAADAKSAAEVALESPTLSKKGRGRPRKASMGAQSTATETPGSPRKRSGKQHVPDSDDDVFAPSKATKEEVARTPYVDGSSEDAVQEAEAGALAWVLFILGGLGVAGAGVLGAEVSRA